MFVSDEIINGKNQKIFIGFLLSPDVKIINFTKNIDINTCLMALINNKKRYNLEIILSANSEIISEDAYFSNDIGHLGKTKRIVLVGEKAPSIIDWNIQIKKLD